MTERRKRKSAADRKAEIVDTAIRLAAELGPDRVTTQHLADEVGVTQPAIFRHFATKSDIWLAVGDRIVSEFADIHTHSVNLSEVDAHDMLCHLVGRHFVHVTQNPAVPAILFSRELQKENASLREKFSGLLDERRKAIAKLIGMAQSAGQHRAEVIAEDTAQLLLATMQGLSMRWLIEDQSFDLAEEGQRLVGSVIDGLRA